MKRLVSPFIAIVFAAGTAFQTGVSPFAFASNLLAFIFGLFLYWKLSVHFIRKFSLAIGVVVLALLASTFLFPGIDGVTRWIFLGPIRLNISMILLPLALFLIHLFEAPKAVCFSFLISGVLFFQPDAGQATAFCASVFVSLFFKKMSSRFFEGMTLLGLFYLTYITWLQRDPLPALDHVERIFYLASGLGPLMILLMMSIVVILLVPFVQIKKSAPSFELSLSYFIYFLISFLVTELGNFPVPVIGAGGSSVLGYFIALTMIKPVQDDR